MCSFSAFVASTISSLSCALSTSMILNTSTSTLSISCNSFTISSDDATLVCLCNLIDSSNTVTSMQSTLHFPSSLCSIMFSCFYDVGCVSDIGSDVISSYSCSIVHQLVDTPLC